MINNHLFPPVVDRHVIFVTIFCILIVIPTSYSDDDGQFVTCSSSYNFSCGWAGLNISYPFWGNNRPHYCGRQGFELKCRDNLHPIMEFRPQTFRVLNINTTDQTITIARDDLNWDSNCAGELGDTTFNPGLFSYSPNVRNLSLFYDCTGEISLGQNEYNCSIDSEERVGFYTVDGFEYFKNLSNNCSKVMKLPVKLTDLDRINYFQGREWLREVLQLGFDVKYEVPDNSLCSACIVSGGICGSNESNSEQFVCLCRDKLQPYTCPHRALPTVVDKDSSLIFELKCHQGSPQPTIESLPQTFQVLNINRTNQTVIIARDDLNLDNNCPRPPENTTFNPLFSSYSPNVRNLSLFYDCTSNFSGPKYYTCQLGGEERKGFYTIDNELENFRNLTPTCKEVIKVPVLLSTVDWNITRLRGREWLRDALIQGFDVDYEAADKSLCSACVLYCGIYGSSGSNPEQFVCLYRDKSRPQTCSPLGSISVYLRKKIIIGISAALMGVTAIFIIICYCKRKRISSVMSNSLCGNISKNEQDIEAFIRDYGPLAPKRYSFSAVKIMTDSFKCKLGEGGYGSVYRGKLLDGNIVAVKLLNTSKGNGQEFINEVASISRTSHVNIVTLLGFCLEGNKKALIYEFMPKGSLEKFIYNDDNMKANQWLGWEKMYQIAIGIARGLEYLHRGCNTRILHFDIKPHNILLDEDFCPKISDFGLAKLCLKKESIVSMLEARGTIGYIAPEVFSRNFGEVSYKSDVYSYGMLVLEMVGGRTKVDDGVAHTSEIYFPHWIYKHIEQGTELKWHGVSTSEENEIAKKIIIVGLWCIQTYASKRPSMNKVIGMLQGSTEALQIPPEPFLTSPPRQRIYSSTKSMSEM